MNNQGQVDVAALFKVVIMGKSGVGKTLLIRRYVEDTFSHEYACTIGVDFKIKMVAHKNSIYKLQIWDTAGQERFRCITPAYYRGSSGILLCYDIANYDSFESLVKTHEEIKQVFANTGKPVPPILMCGLKSDLDEERQVAPDTALAFAESNGFKFIENSSKTSFNVNDTFETLLVDMIEFQKNGEPLQIKNQKIENIGNNHIEQKRSCC